MALLLFQQSDSRVWLVLFLRGLERVPPQMLSFPEMSTLAENEAAVKVLPVREKQALLQFLDSELQRTDGASATGNTQRIAGLHTGACVVAPDFDAPLADQFWLGHDA
jgi:hypothetical protein